VTVEVDGLHDLNAARAEGVRASSAPVVLVAETHAFPRAGWLDAVIAAHREADLVIPAFENGNPASALSWSGFLADYGSFGRGRASGDTPWWPGFNVTYDRAKLLEIEGRIEEVFASGPAAWTTLRERGWRVHFEPAAEVLHLNVDMPLAWVDERYVTGRVLGGRRSEDWGPGRRLLFALASPLVAPVLLRRTRPALVLARNRRRLPAGTTLAWILGMGARALGEGAGFLLGPSGRAEQRLLDYELFKADYVRTEVEPA
jgi:hypothetical protein